MEKCDCPIQTIAQMLGSKWVILILRDMFLGKQRFNEFLTANSTLSNKVLASKLREMQDANLIEKVMTKTSIDVIYKLTPFGESFKPVFIEMARLGKVYCTKETDFTRFVDSLKA